MSKKTVVIGFFGTKLDSASNKKRWKRWRPTLSICQHSDQKIDRLDLIIQESWHAKALIEDIETVSPKTKVVTHLIPLEDPWDFEAVYEALHLFAREYDFVPEKEEYLIHLTTGTHVAQICLFLLTEARFIPGKLLQSGPTRDNPTKNIIDLELARYEQIAVRFDEERQKRSDRLKGGIATKNRVYNTMISEIELVAARSKAPILLTGPTGAGKTHLARRIYETKQANKKVTGKFIEINCATLRGDTAMSALFGHKKGAFTGAYESRKGVLLRAHKGVLFLDEIGELGLDEQAMLLRAVEDRLFLPVGAEKEVFSDFQLIAGSNRDLQKAVQNGIFRSDLLARINLWHFTLLGLADRREDIAPNLDYELENHSRKHERRLSMTKEAREKYLLFAIKDSSSWCGNFRDLANSVERMGTLAESSRISESDVEREQNRLIRSWSSTRRQSIVEKYLDPETFAKLDRFDRVQLEDVLRVCEASSSISEAGRRLFSESRKRRSSKNDGDRLRKYLLRHDLSWKNINDEKVSY